MRPIRRIITTNKEKGEIILKKTTILLLSIVIGLCAIGVSFALDVNVDINNIDEREKKQGKSIYRAECRQCHKADSEVGAPNLSPDSKVMAHWQEAFTDYSDLECAKEWEKKSEEDLRLIFLYLYSGASDSPTPAKCL